MMARGMFLTALTILILAGNGWGQVRTLVRGGAWNGAQSPRVNQPAFSHGFGKPTPIGPRQPRFGAISPRHAPAVTEEIGNPNQLSGRRKPGSARGGIHVSPFFNPFFNPYFAPALTPFPFNAMLNGFLNPYAAEFGYPDPYFIAGCGFSCEPFVGFNSSDPPAGRMNPPVQGSFDNQEGARTGSASLTGTIKNSATSSSAARPQFRPRAAPEESRYTVPAPLANEPLVIESGYDSQP